MQSFWWNLCCEDDKGNKYMIEILSHFIQDKFEWSLEVTCKICTIWQLYSKCIYSSTYCICRKEGRVQSCSDVWRSRECCWFCFILSSTKYRQSVLHIWILAWYIKAVSLLTVILICILSYICDICRMRMYLYLNDIIFSPKIQKQENWLQIPQNVSLIFSAGLSTQCIFLLTCAS